MDTSSGLNKSRAHKMFVGFGMLFIVGFLCMLDQHIAPGMRRNSINENYEEVHLKVATGHKEPEVLKALGLCIDECEEWLLDFPRDTESVARLARMYMDRGRVYTSLGMYEEAARDIGQQALNHKRAGEIQFYGSSSCHQAQLLRRAGRWSEATALCHEVIRVLGEDDASYRPYGLLVDLTKKHPNPDPKDVAAIDEYRRMAMLLARNDWREEE